MYFVAILHFNFVVHFTVSLSSSYFVVSKKSTTRCLVNCENNSLQKTKLSDITATITDVKSSTSHIQKSESTQMVGPIPIPSKPKLYSHELGEVMSDFSTASPSIRVGLTSSAGKKCLC